MASKKIKLTLVIMFHPYYCQNKTLITTSTTRTKNQSSYMASLSRNWRREGMGGRGRAWEAALYWNWYSPPPPPPAPPAPTTTTLGDKKTRRRGRENASFPRERKFRDKKHKNVQCFPIKVHYLLGIEGCLMGRHPSQTPQWRNKLAEMTRIWRSCSIFTAFVPLSEGGSGQTRCHSTGQRTEGNSHHLHCNTLAYHCKNGEDTTTTTTTTTTITTTTTTIIITCITSVSQHERVTQLYLSNGNVLMFSPRSKIKTNTEWKLIY